MNEPFGNWQMSWEFRYHLRFRRLLFTSSKKIYRNNEDEDKEDTLPAKLRLAFHSLQKRMFSPLCLLFPFYFPGRKELQEKHITQKEPGLKENNKIKW